MVGVSGLSLRASKIPSNDLAITNRIYANPADVAQLSGGAAMQVYVSLHSFVFSLEAKPQIEAGRVAFNTIQRQFAKIPLEQDLFVKLFVPPKGFDAGAVKVEVDAFQPDRVPKLSLEVKDEDLEALFRKMYAGQVMASSMKMICEHLGHHLAFTVLSLSPVDFGDGSAAMKITSGLLASHTELEFVQGSSGKVQVLSDRVTQRSIFRPDFNFEELGIGGLDTEFGNIFRRAFAARVFPPHVVRDLGIQHVRGMLLHGPPGTGKTLIARQLAKFLKAAEPKIVNGPEILNKYVGQAEENIRNLFGDAERDQRELGDQSQLHVVIFDEIDSICKSRGSTRDGTGVHDSIVNQLLSKIDGVDSLNNILLIGMTNRMDLIDDALLRPGRLEVHVEISLPDEPGRAQILNIHMKDMISHGYLEKEVSVDWLATSTKNFSGAELAGLIRTATSYALNRKVNVHDLSRAKAEDADMKISVTKGDFEQALTEVKPAYGQHDDDFEQCLTHGIMAYSSDFTRTLQACESLIEQVRCSENTPLLTVLLHGELGCGKTALTAHLAKRSGFPYVRRLGNENCAGYSESAKIATLTRVIEDAYKSPLSLVILDDIERFIEYVRVGPRFSNALLQALFSFLKKRPPKQGRRLLILCTSSAKEFLGDTELDKVFNVSLLVPVLTKPEHFRLVLEKLPGFADDVVNDIAMKLHHQSVGISKLLLVAEMAVQRQSRVTADVFMDCYHAALH